MSHSAATQNRLSVPCRLSGPGADVDPSAGGRGDGDLVARLTAVSDITGAVSELPWDVGRPGADPVDLAAVLVAVARAATRRLDDRILVFVRQETIDGATTPTVPDVCVPVAADGGPAGPAPVGHLHLVCGNGIDPTAADHATVDFLAGHAVDIAAACRRERAHLDDVARLRHDLRVAQEEAAQLTVALASNRDIGVAMGILVALERLSPEQAFARLSEASQNSNRKLREVADAVVLSGGLED